MALKLNLKPGDRLYMGTSKVLVTGTGYATIIIEGDMPVLRESDAIEPDDVTTIAQRFRYAIQQAYLSGETGFLDAAQGLCGQLEAGQQAAEECLALFRVGQRFKALREAIAIDQERRQDRP